MYQNLITPVMLKHAFAKSMDYPSEDFTEILSEWLTRVEPLVTAINKLNTRIDDLNNGCKKCQQHMKEELEKCLTIKNEDTAER